VYKNFKMTLYKGLKYYSFNILVNRNTRVGKLLSKVKVRKKHNFKIFSVGLPRSGTHSLANIFQPYYRAAHEPLAGPSIRLLLDIEKKELSKKEIEDRILIRNDLLQLELESSHFLYDVVPYLVKLIPESKFILTVREPKSWVESELNMNMKTYGSIWTEYEHYRYKKFKYKYNLDALTNLKGVYPIQTYFEYYKHHILKVINHVPKERLLVLDTFDINNSVEKICEFTGATCQNLNLNKIHSSRSKNRKVKICEIVNENLINQLITDHLGALIQDRIPLLNKYLN